MSSIRRLRSSKISDSRDQSRSPTRETSRTSRSSRSSRRENRSISPKSRSRSRSSKIDRSFFQPDFSEEKESSGASFPKGKEDVRYIRDTIDTEFTFGAEFDAGWDIHFNEKLEDHYDRNIAYKKTEHLKATYEYFEKKDGMEYLTTCPYTMELALGVYKYDHICDFLNDKVNIYISNMAENIDMFKSDILKTQNIKDILKTLYSSKVNNVNKIQALADGKAFENCSMTQKLDDDTRSYFYTEFKGITNIQGVPQVTVGLNYAFFPNIFKHFSKDRKTDTGLSQIIINNILEVFNLSFPQDISWLVLKGLLYVVIYTSYIHSTYYKFEGGPQYFKGAMIFKPRSNLAVSYKKLKQEYTNIEKYMIMFNNNLISLITTHIGHENFYELENINTENDLYEFKLKIIGEIISKEEDSIESEKIKDQVRQRTRTKNIYDLHSSVISNIKNFASKLVVTKYSELVKILTEISSFYLIKKIMNPIKAYRVNKFIREKVDNICSNYQLVLDGSIYLLDKIKNPKQYILDYEEIDFASLFDPPSLFLSKNRKLCTDSRVEVFEMVPDNSNFIMEVRSVNLFTYDDEKRLRPRFITLDQMTPLMKDFFEKLKTLIRGANLSQFLGDCRERSLREISLKLLPSKEQITFLSPEKIYDSSKRESSMSSMPSMLSTLDDYLDDTYKRQSCQVMFRPKSKKSKTKKENKERKSKKRSKKIF